MPLRFLSRNVSLDGFPFRRTLLLIVLVGGILRAFNLSAPWMVKGHYNFGGPFHSRHVFCLQNSDWSVTRGIPHSGCAAESNLCLSPVLKDLPLDLQEKACATEWPRATSQEAVFYPNHPVTFNWILLGLTKIFGEHEAVFRSFTLIFSMACIWLVGLLAGFLWGSSAGLLAAILQAGTLGGLFYGTHVDYPSEVTGFLFLASSYFALSGNWILAVGLTLVNGAFDWPGFILLVPLFLLAWRKQQGRLTVAVGGVFSVILIVALVTHLIGIDRVSELLSNRIFNSGHAQETASNPVFRYSKMIYEVLYAYAHLLGPALCALFLISLAGLKWNLKKFWQDLATQKDHQLFFLLGLTSIITCVMGPTYVIIHEFWLIPTMMMGPLLVAKNREGQAPNPLWLVYFLVLLSVARFPLGIWTQSQLLNWSAGFAMLISIIFLIQNIRRRRALLTYGVLIFLLLGNLLTFLNYRVENRSEKDFCTHALKEYLEAGTPVLLDDPSLARLYYCRGIPTH